MVTDARLLTETLTANQQLFNDSLRHAVFLERLKTGEARKVVSFLNDKVFPDMLDTLQKRLARITTTGIDPGPVTTRRLQQMITEMSGLMKGGLNEVGNNLTGSLKDIAQAESEFALKSLSKVTKGLNISFTSPSVPLLRAIVTTRPMQGRLIKKWFNDLEPIVRGDITNQLQIGLASGETIPQIARRFVGTAPAAFKDGVFGRARKNAESLARTSVNHVTTRAREMTYMENEDVIKGVQIIATLDSRTTQICMSLDGQIFPVGEGERPPYHHQCRTTTAPVLKSWKELGIDLKEAPPGTRAAFPPTTGKGRNKVVGKAGQVDGRLTYGTWLKGQPKAVQNQILGPGKADLFRRGKVKFDKFIDQRNRPLTLDQLRKLEGLPPAPPKLKATPPVKADPKNPVVTPGNMDGKQLRTFMKDKFNPARVQSEISRLTNERTALLKRSDDLDAAFFEKVDNVNNTLRRMEGDLSKLSDDLQKFILDEGGIPVTSRHSIEGVKHFKIVDDLVNKANDISGRQFTLQTDLRDKMRRSLTVNKPSKVEGRFLNKNGNTLANNADNTILRRNVNEGFDIFNNMVSRSVSGPMEELPITVNKIRKNGRAFARQRSINMSMRNSSSVTVHELGHVLESQNPGVGKRAIEFLKKRAGNTQFEKLSELTDNPFYGSGEVAWKDRFVDVYMGKRYVFAGELRATEIMSMGLEMLYTDPAKLLLNDPEMFDFIVNVARGFVK